MRVLAIALNPTIDVSVDVDRVEPTRKLRTSNQKRHPGGGGVNVARVIVELGGQPELLVLAGGTTGALLEAKLRALPIDLHLVPITRSTRVAFMVYEQQTGLEYRFVPEGPEILPAEIEAAMDCLRRFRGDFVVASGSLPAGAPDNTYVRMADIANKAGAKFILDTSGAELKCTLDKARVFLVKPSLGELAELVGKPVTADNAGEAAMTYVRNGAAQYVAVTLGSEGALLASANGILRLPAIKVKAKSAVGAGDSFIGALVWFLMQGKSMEEAFRFGSAAGAAAVLTSGTQLCRRADIFALYESN